MKASEPMMPSKRRRGSDDGLHHHLEGLGMIRKKTGPKSTDTQSVTFWELRRNGKSRDYDIFDAGSPASAGKIARVFSRDGRDKIARAHAILIVAAPQLLAAIERAVELYGKEGGPWNGPGAPGSWLYEARAAINAATGD